MGGLSLFRVSPSPALFRKSGILPRSPVPSSPTHLIRSMLFRLLTCLLAFMVVAAAGAPLFAHPGHDAHAPQHGVIHWLLSPVHWTMMGFLVAIFFALLFSFRLANLRLANRAQQNRLRIEKSR